MERNLAARRALLHPLWLGSLAVLALNDHVLKGASLLPGAITGKLSDFAGLVVAPALLAALLRLRTTRALTLAHVATGAVFAAINLSPAVARAFESIAALGPFPWRITVDPTDLVALPALLVSMRVLVPAMARPLPERPLAHRALAAVGALACAATSEPVDPPPNCPDETCSGVPRESAALVLGNTTDDTRLIRLRPLRSAVEVDCPTLLANPEQNLSRELFAPAETWLLEPNRGLPLQNDDARACVAYLVDADGLAPTLLAWSGSKFATMNLSTATNAFEEGRMIPLSLDSNGKLSLGAHPAVFPAPPFEEPAPAAGCASPDATVGIEWSTPVPFGGPYLVESVTSSPDDCHAIALQGKSTMYLCAPKAALPIQAGDSIEVSEINGLGGSFPEAGGEFVEADGLSIRSASYTILAVRGNALARYSVSGAVEPIAEPTVEATMVKSCGGTNDECGTLFVPIEVSYLGAHVPNITFLRAGQSLALSDGYGTLHLVRADGVPIRDTSCAPFAKASRHYESVLVIPTGP